MRVLVHGSGSGRGSVVTAKHSLQLGVEGSNRSRAAVSASIKPRIRNVGLRNSSSGFGGSFESGATVGEDPGNGEAGAEATGIGSATCGP